MAAGATAPIGLTAGELAVNITQRRMFVGDTAGNTVELAGLSANSFTGLNTFAAGISANGATFSGSVTAPTPNPGTNNTQVATTAFVANNSVARVNGISGGITLNAGTNISITSSVAGGITIASSGTPSNVVSSLNGFTGAVGISGGKGITLDKLGGNQAIIQPAINYNYGGLTFPTYKLPYTIQSGMDLINKDSILLQASSSNPFVTTLEEMYLTTLGSFKRWVGGGALGSIGFTGTEFIPIYTEVSGDTAASGLMGVTTFTKNILDSGVNSFNGRTGAVQGVSAAVAGSGISVSAATGSVTISNTGVLSFNGNAGAVTGASLGANTFTGLQTSATGFSGPLTGNATTATNSTQLGGVAAASYALLASPTFTGTPASTTAAVGTNTTQIATTAFVQNEIIADTVTSFNGRTGSVQGVSAAVAGNGITVSGATGSVTITNAGVTRAVAGTGISVNANTGTVTITNSGVLSFNGNAGAVTGASLGANTFTGLQTINSGGLFVNGGGTTFGASQGVVFEYGLRQTRVTSNITNSGGLIVDRGTTLGSASGAPLTVRGGPLNLLNNSSFNVYTGTTSGFAGNCPLNVYASGNIGLYPSNPDGGVGLGTYAQLTISAGAGIGDGGINIGGSDLILGTKSADGEIYTPVALKFTGTSVPTRYTTLTANPSGSDKTITLPNESGTVALETKSNARGWFM
jgi:hypothetical protein